MAEHLICNLEVVGSTPTGGFAGAFHVPSGCPVADNLNFLWPRSEYSIHPPCLLAEALQVFMPRYPQTFMLRTRWRNFVLWLCALSVSISSGVLVHGLVQCTSADGTTRVEWMCSTDLMGHCESSCDVMPRDHGADEHSQSAPCDDAPLKKEAAVASRPCDRTDGEFVMMTLALPASTVALPGWTGSVFSPGPRAVTSKPPPSLRSLRSIILLV